MIYENLLLLIVHLVKEIQTLLKQRAQSDEALAILTSQIIDMRRNRFGSKSERYTDPENPQFSLYDVIEGEYTEFDGDGDDEEGESSSNVVNIKSFKRKKKRNRKFSEHITRIETIVPVDEDNRTCHCGCQKIVINHADHERLHCIPAVFEVHVERREVMACPNKCSKAMVTADKPNHILPKSRYTEAMLAYIIVSKFDDRLPYYHLEKQLESRSGVPYPRQSMARHCIKISEQLVPLVNLMKDEVINYDVASLDPSVLQVLKEPGRAATTKSYIYCMRGGEPGKEVTVFEYNAEQHKPFVDNWFAGFKGTVHCDADPFFELMFQRDGIFPAGCNIHSRRNFEPIAKGRKGKGLAAQAMSFYRSLYKIERQATDEKMSHQQRYELRQRLTKPLMEKFKQWLDEFYPTVIPKTPLYKAFTYSLKYWERLCRFLDDGRLEPDNNLTEQEVKAYVILRKNFLFCDSIDGAKALGVHLSLIRTAKLHGLDPFQYYVKVLKEIPHCQSVEDYEALLPWNIELEKVGSVSAAA